MITKEFTIDYVGLLRKLQKIRNFKGSSQEFWDEYVSLILDVSKATTCLICSDIDKDESDWRVIAIAPKDKDNHSYIKMVLTKIKELNEGCVKNGHAIIADTETTVLALQVLTGSTNPSLIILTFPQLTKQHAVECVNILRAMNDLFHHYNVKREVDENYLLQNEMKEMLEILGAVNSHPHFMSAVMALCNELAQKYSCERVSLGWLKGNYLKVTAMSHVDEYEKKMDAVQLLEQAMEEAFDQHETISIPNKSETRVVVRDHLSYMKNNDVDSICSIPLRYQGELVAVCTLERNDCVFKPEEIQTIQFTCEHLTTRLSELKYNDRWFGAVFFDNVKKKVEKISGYEHSWLKVGIVFISLMLALVSMLPVVYRIDSPMILRTENVTYLTAPFDGYIDSVGFQVGENVSVGDTLLILDRKNLLLEEASLIAEKNKYRRELEKARAAKALADMRIAKAMVEQATAQLNTIKYRLKQATILSPYDGVIIEGEQSKRIGSPIQQGEVLFKIARTDRLYAELKISEQDIHLLNTDMTGEIALSSNPGEVFEIDVTRIEPSAIVEGSGNIFRVHGTLQEDTPEWFRPGMTGVSKINAGKRTILWIFTHETIDFLKMRLWW